MKDFILKTGDICKHFKGTSLVEKNIYKIAFVNVTYTGEVTDSSLKNMVVYESIFQEGKTFVCDMDRLLEELPAEKQELYHQTYRVEKLSDAELMEIETEEFKQKKIAYLNQKYGK